MVGIDVTKDAINARMGGIALAFQQLFTQVGGMKGYYDRTPDADLVALGFTDEQVALQKAMIEDAYLMGQLFAGQATLEQAKDFRVFISQFWGLGSF